MIKAIIFDFDGVILESVGVKVEAFRRLFEDHPALLAEILKYHMINGGISRFEKFKVIYRDILKKDFNDDISWKLGERFSQYSYDAVINAEFVPGAEEFLADFYQTLAFFIVSGTPQEEMESVVRDRNLVKYFKGVYGSPRTKAELIDLIVSKNGFRKDEVVFVGDSINDWEGAREAGVCFIGRVHDQYPDPFVGQDVDGIIRDLNGLKGALDQLI